MWMRHPCSCTARWCGRHNETRLSSSVRPPSGQWMMWWPSVHAGGRSQPGKRQPWSRSVERGADVRRDRARRPSDRERQCSVGCRPGKSAPSAGGATVTTVRTASQAIRRAVSGWIGPTPLKHRRLCIGAGRAAQRSARTVSVRWGRCPCTSRWSPQRSWWRQCRPARRPGAASPSGSRPDRTCASASIAALTRAPPSASSCPRRNHSPP